MDNSCLRAMTDTPAASAGVKFDRLKLFNNTSVDLGGLVAQARALGHPWSEQLLSGSFVAEDLVGRRDGSYVVVCYDLPKDRLAHYIQERSLPSEALTEWAAETKALLSIYGASYGSMALVSRDVLLYRYDEVAEALSARSGMFVPSACAQLAFVEGAGEAPTADGLQRQLIARQLALHPQAAKLAQFLEASSILALDSESALGDIDELYSQLSKCVSAERECMRRERDGLSEDNSRLRRTLEELAKEGQLLGAENELVVKQLHRAQEQLEVALLVQRKREKEVLELTRSIKEKNSKLQKLSATCRGARKDRNELAAELKRAQAELALLYSSRSWWVTSPLRRGMAFFRRNAKGRSE